MSIFDSDRLDFDTENLNQQKQTIKNLADELRGHQDSLRSLISELKGDWKTAAGLKFFEKYDEEWVKKLDGHIEMLEALVSALQKAVDTYEPLATKYSNIALEDYHGRRC